MMRGSTEFSPGPQGTRDGSHSNYSPFRPGAGDGVSSGSRTTWGCNIPSAPWVSLHHSSCTTHWDVITPQVRSGVSDWMEKSHLFKLPGIIFVVIVSGESHNSISETRVVVSFVVTCYFLVDIFFPSCFSTKLIVRGRHNWNQLLIKFVSKLINHKYSDHICLNNFYYGEHNC